MAFGALSIALATGFELEAVPAISYCNLSTLASVHHLL